MDDPVEVLVTVVLAADGEDAAHAACRELLWQTDGRIIASADCSAEEPGCWSVTLRVPSEERATHNMAAPLARAVRQLVRGLGPDFAMPRVACEPPTAWTVLDDPDALAVLVPGAERLLVEAWCGGDPYGPGESEIAEPPAEPPTGHRPEPEPGAEATDVEESRDDPDEPAPAEPDRRHEPPRDGDSTLTLRVEVATARAAGAEWQARALASRISRTATLTAITEHDGVCTVLVDLGTAHTPAPQTVLTAVSALDRPGWSALRWEGDTATATWTAHPRPNSGITELELSSGPAVRHHRP